MIFTQFKNKVDTHVHIWHAVFLPLAVLTCILLLTSAITVQASGRIDMYLKSFIHQSTVS
jgi:hypothetical protein